jgi:hypothetical protein
VDFGTPVQAQSSGVVFVSDSSGKRVTSEAREPHHPMKPGRANLQVGTGQLSAKASRFVIVSLQTCGYIRLTRTRRQSEQFA